MTYKIYVNGKKLCSVLIINKYEDLENNIISINCKEVK